MNEWPGVGLAAAAGGVAGWVIDAVLAQGLHRRPGDTHGRPAPRVLVAAACALSWVLVAARGRAVMPQMSPNGRWLLLSWLLALVTVLVALAAIDAEVRRLPDALTRPALLGGAAVIALLCAAGEVLVSDTARALAAAVAADLAYRLWRRLSPGGRAVGLGDVKLAGVLGLTLGVRGWGYVAAGLYLGLVLTGAAAGALLLTRRLPARGTLPHGPFMIAGALLALLGPG